MTENTKALIDFVAVVIMMVGIGVPLKMAKQNRLENLRDEITTLRQELEECRGGQE